MITDKFFNNLLKKIDTQLENITTQIAEVTLGDSNRIVYAREKIIDSNKVLTSLACYEPLLKLIKEIGDTKYGPNRVKSYTIYKSLESSLMLDKLNETIQISFPNHVFNKAEYYYGRLRELSVRPFKYEEIPFSKKRDLSVLETQLDILVDTKDFIISQLKKLNNDEKTKVN